MQKMWISLVLVSSLWGFSLSPSAVPGGVELVPLGVSSDEPPRVFWGQVPLRTERLSDGSWAALVGLPLGSDPKESQMIHFEDSTKGRVQIAFSLTPKTYPSQYITIDETRYVHPGEEEMERIALERIALRESLERFTPQSLAPLSFKKPLGGRISGAFGVRRFFNGEERNSHNGLDIAAPRHSPIGASQAGRVVMTGDLFFCGRMVLLDHGQGLLSLYCHLEAIGVKPDQMVAQSERIGTVGSSGRATGPHLHWGIWLNGTWVDPSLFVAN